MKFLSMGRRAWATVLTCGAALLAIAGAVSDIGGAKDQACSISAVEKMCRGLGWAPEPVDKAAESRRLLIAAVEGVWGPRGCARKFRYSVDARPGGATYIVARTDGYRSEGKVVSAADGVIFTRTTAPASAAGEQWELRPEDDRLIVIDKDGVPTPLTRCG